jgi:F-type H+-transporting ATPase subunit delta
LASTKTYAKRYAQAIFQLALEKNELDKWRADLAMVVGLGGNVDLVALLKNPKVPFEDKTKLLAQFLVGASPSTLKLVYLLVSQDRLHLVNEIQQEFQRLLDTHYGIEPAVVVTAIELDEETRSGLVKHLEALLGKKVLAEYRVDPQIIGGVVIRAGGKLLDCSTRSRLMALKKELIATRR